MKEVNVGMSGVSLMSEIRQKEVEYCRENPEYFVDTYGHIEDKDNAESIIQPFSMWGEQRAAFRSILENKFNVILKARQLGITWLVLHVAAWMLICFEGRTVIALSQKEDDAKELIRRIGQVILRNMPELVAEDKAVQRGWDGPVFSCNALEIKIRYPSGMTSVITGMPSSPGAGRSWTANLIILDEWAFQPFAEEIWKSGFPTVNRPTGGQVIGLSTIERGSFFEQVFTDPDNGFNKIFIPWYADPRRDQEWYDRTKQAMGDAITQEYPASIEEALTVPGGAFFPEVNARNTVSKVRLDAETGNVVRYVCIDYGLDMFSAHWVMVNSRGEAQVYKEFDSPNKTITEAAGILKAMCLDETIHSYLAPPDLWSRRQETGKSAADIFAENEINLTKTNNDMLNGCLSMKEWLRPRPNPLKDGEVEKSKLTILEGEAPNLYKCLQKIQKDKNKPNIYAKQPHDLTHDVDSLRCFCVYWTISAEEKTKAERKKTWTADLLEDWENASEEDKRYLEQKYGEPIL